MATETTTTRPFAIIATGGKQYLVREGDTVEVERLGDLAEGDTVTFDEVLLADNGTKTTVGTPTTGDTVTGTYLGLKKGKKLNIIRFEAKSNRDRRVGHRQTYARVRIDKIS